MIVKNEESCLEDALKSVNWADEIIVVDAESTDSTISIASKYTDRIFVHKWEGFAAQKRYALSLASNEWILNIDADERVSDNLKKEIMTFNSGAVDGYKIPRENYLLDRHISSCGWNNDYQLRLFRKSKASVTERLVHEGFEVNGSFDNLKSSLIHLTFTSTERTISKVNIYSSLQAQEKFNKTKKVKIHTIILHALSAFMKDFISLRGYRDGIYGFIVSLISGITTLLVYVKIWELQNSQDHSLRD
ncbi:MAG: glycosyltransferase family 2 protein [Ignavibacteriaceae bacterium]|nr:glycosyltransferase family 2 protein [Ignavibacteriaceae bacterium]